MNDDRNSIPIRLTDRERSIVEYAVRNRIITNEVIHPQFFGDAHPSRVTRTTARLCEAGWLQSFPLIYPTKYFVPGKQAIAAYGLPKGRCYPLGPQSLPTEYASLQYASANPDRLTRLTPEEISERHPWYAAEWTLAPHCERVGGSKAILELLRVDLGAAADHIARKCRRDIRLRRRAPEFDRLISDGEFSMVIITGSTSKAASIQSALDQHLWPKHLQFRIAVFISLISILPRGL